MAIRSKKIIKPIIWIPPIYTTTYDLSVERNDETVDNITSICPKFEIKDGVTEVAGIFSFEIHDPNEEFKNKWQLNNIVRFKTDYAPDATTLKFRGRIDKVNHSENKLKVSGRGEASKFIDITVTKQYTNTECSIILKDLISSYNPGGFTDSNVETTTKSLTINWYQQPFWDAVTELATATGSDFYVDANRDFHFFIVGSRSNDNDAVLHDYNLLETGDFAQDGALVKNRIIIYGAETDGVQIIYTAEDSDSIAFFDPKEEIINDSNITSYDQAKEIGDFILAKKKDPPIVGELTASMLATIQPGEKIRISDPINNISPGFKDIVSYTHTLGDKGLITKVSVSKEPRKSSHVFKSIIENQSKSLDATVNPFEMRFAYNFLFDEEAGAHTNTQVTNGVLKLIAGQSSGTWISGTRVLTANITSAYLVLKGETLTGVSISVSGNDGIDYQAISPKEKIDLTTAIGKNLKVKAVFSNADTQIDSLSLQYRTG